MRDKVALSNQERITTGRSNPSWTHRVSSMYHVVRSNLPIMFVTLDV
jgi:hypothetical protein